MSQAHESRIPVSRETRRLVKQQKRGGGNYDTLLRELVTQYDTQEGGQTPQGKE